MREDISANLIAGVYTEHTMRDARFNFITLLLLIFAFGANSVQAATDNPLPEELRWAPVDIISTAIVEVPMVDSIIPMSPQFSR